MKTTNKTKPHFIQMQTKYLNKLKLSNMKTQVFFAIMIALTLGFISCKQGEQQSGTQLTDASTIETVGHAEELELTSPPNVPAPVGDRPAKKLIVRMETIEKVGELADGTEYTFWTFDGTVPGSFIRARVGDEIEFRLKNNENNLL